MIKNILIAVAILSIIGCSARPIRTVQYTDDTYIIAARTKKVEVQAQKQSPLHIKEDLWVDSWNLRLVNNDTKKSWCASIDWRQMDYTIQVPNVWFYLPPNSYTDIGLAVQKTWQLSESTLTFNDAAFTVYRLKLLKPSKGQCVVKSKQR